MREIWCWKCHGGRSSIHRRIETLEDGTRLEVLACICGNWIEHRELVQPRYKSVGQSNEQAAKPGPKKGRATNNKPCAIRDCTGKHSGTGKFPLCKPHYKRLYSWMTYPCFEHRTPPPLQRVNGVWIERNMQLKVNDEVVERNHPLPGIPGELPVKASPQKIGKEKARRTRQSPWVGKCEKCGARKPIAAWSTCFDCLDAEREEVSNG